MKIYNIYIKEKRKRKILRRRFTSFTSREVALIHVEMYECVNFILYHITTRGRGFIFLQSNNKYHQTI